VIERGFLAMEEKIKIECLIWLLIKEMGTQKAIAKAIGIRFQKINYWLNYAKTVPAEYLSKLLVLLRTCGIAPEDKHITLQDVVGLMPRSQLVKWAMEALLQGRNDENQTPVENNSGQEANCQNFDNVTPNSRLDNEIAKKYGFGNRGTLRQAMAVIKNGCDELVEAMDKKMVSIYRASRLSALCVPLQQELVAQGKDAIKAYFKQQNSKPSSKKMTHFEWLRKIETHQQLKALEIIHQLPLRQIVMGLSAQCDSKGQFIWDLEQLKTGLLLKEVPLKASLAVLCQHRMIKQKRLGKKLVGVILL
jgi:hypothetical protein